MIKSISLVGKTVELIPLQENHLSALQKAAADGELWNLWFTSVPTFDTTLNYIDKALKEQKQGQSLPFAVLYKPTNRIIGTTRYCNIEPDSKRLEIGYTWYAKSFQKTGVNTECKYLLLKYAFERLNAIAVEFRTHWFNFPSRAAITRLGAKQDGVLRNHRIDKDGTIRDTVVFSIIASEWQSVRKSLEFKMKTRL